MGSLKSELSLSKPQSVSRGVELVLTVSLLQGTKQCGTGSASPPCQQASEKCARCRSSSIVGPLPAAASNVCHPSCD